MNSSIQSSRYSKKPSINISSLPTNKNNVCSDFQENLEKEYSGQCDIDIDSNECNKFLLKKEFADRQCISVSEKEKESEDSFLYPEFNDTLFNVKIAEKKEFQETKYDGKIHPDVKLYADELSKAEFEIQPHQAFVRNFLSFQTPYNSLLLYHGLGSGKTYSAIGVCEEMREYLKNLGQNKRILVVASENVQNNFRTQMFDERRLKLVNDRWTISGYVANQLLKEVNPMNNPGISKEKIVSQVKALINRSYLFLGYGQLANYIIHTMGTNEMSKNDDRRLTKQDRTSLREKEEEQFIISQLAKQRLKNEFQGRLIVIDEIHNIRKAEDAESKKVAIHLELLVKAVREMRLLFLSATPMFNSYKEMIWLLNLMNLNDKRATVNVKDVFDTHGNFKPEGRELFIRKVTGYVSFVRGENPYTFPYRVYPSLFASEKTFPDIAYPLYQMNGKRIRDEDRERILSLYLTKINGTCLECGSCQYCNYRYLMYYLRYKNMNVTTKKGKVREMRSFLNMTKFGYTLLQTPLETLIIAYPNEKLKELIKQIPAEVYSDELAERVEEIAELDEEETVTQTATATTNKAPILTNGEKPDQPTIDFTVDPRDLTGKRGLERMMDFVDKTTVPPEKGSFEYKKSTLDQYGRIFSPSIIGKYSAKIKNVLESIRYSLSETTPDDPFPYKVADGVILVYSQYIDAGLIPMALALEEMGFTRYGKEVKPLFKNPPTEVVDVRTLKPRPRVQNQGPEGDQNFLPARYALITGDSRLSPDNEYEVKGLTNEDNKDGHKVKIVLISRTGAEGIDFKYIRQIHILEPWYNMNRIEQIIGRGVRNSSHQLLPFEKRNVEIFMYGTILGENQEEAADLYVYRVAEYKAVQIGRVTRVLKETAVDCLLNHGQTNFTQEKMAELMKKPVTQILSQGQVIENFQIGDMPYSPACDYMATCDYQCIPDKKIRDSDINSNTYGEAFMNQNNEKIVQNIRRLMKERYFYVKKDLIRFLQVPKAYPLVQLYSALTQMIEEKEVITDRYGRSGALVNIGEYYLFQPLELTDSNISVFDRSVPIDYKQPVIRWGVEEESGPFQIKKRENIVEDSEVEEQEQKKEQEKEQKKEQKKEQVLEGKNVLNMIRKRYDTIQDAYNLLSQNKPISQEIKGQLEGFGKWYTSVPQIMKVLIENFSLSLESLNPLLIDHMIESLFIPERVELLNTTSHWKKVERLSLEWFVKEHFMKAVIILPDFDAIIFPGTHGKEVFVLNQASKLWVPAEPEDLRDLENSTEGRVKLNPKIDSSKTAFIGFIGYEKKNQSLVFKVRDITAKRDLGARCDQAEKSKTIRILNQVIGEERFTVENTKNKFQKDDLCVLLELLMRIKGYVVMPSS
jgi:hypothetical protein